MRSTSTSGCSSTTSYSPYPKIEYTPKYIFGDGRHGSGEGGAEAEGAGGASEVCEVLVSARVLVLLLLLLLLLELLLEPVVVPTSNPSSSITSTIPNSCTSTGSTSSTNRSTSSTSTNTSTSTSTTSITISSSAAHGPKLKFEHGRHGSGEGCAGGEGDRGAGKVCEHIMVQQVLLLVPVLLLHLLLLLLLLLLV